LDSKLINPAAVQVVRDALTAESRILVLGAGGWFGSTTLSVIGASGRNAAVLAVTGRPRTLALGAQSWSLEGWDWDAISRFEPSLVANCAFLTRERADQVGFERYVAENTALTSRFLRTLALPSVRAAITISSGAAVSNGAYIPDIEQNPYGHLKRAEEILSADAAEALDVALVICRAWSVSGAFVTRPDDYAFSNLICQAMEGHVHVRASHEVWRRYVGVDDLLATAVASASQSTAGVFDSGGELVEIGELARRIVDIINPAVPIERVEAGDASADRYFSDNVSWSAAHARVGLVPASLDEQIRVAAAGLARP
jgi:nucleoside-diphosphate-sugar epimerase